MLHVEQFVGAARACLCAPDPLHAVEALVRDVVSNPAAVRDAVAERAGTASALGFDVFCRSETMTVFHAALEPGFRTATTGRGRRVRRHAAQCSIAALAAPSPRSTVDAAAPDVMVRRRVAPSPIRFRPLPAPSTCGNDHFDASRSMYRSR
jgi:hypothetical protein